MPAGAYSAPRPDRPGRPRRDAEFTSQVLNETDLDNGRITFTGNWKPDRLWDLHTPGNLYSLSLSLLDATRPGAGYGPATCDSGSASSGSTAATST